MRYKCYSVTLHHFFGDFNVCFLVQEIESCVLTQRLLVIICLLHDCSADDKGSFGWSYWAHSRCGVFSATSRHSHELRCSRSAQNLMEIIALDGWVRADNRQFGEVLWEAVPTPLQVRIFEAPSCARCQLSPSLTHTHDSKHTRMIVNTLACW